MRNELIWEQRIVDMIKKQLDFKMMVDVLNLDTYRKYACYIKILICDFFIS